MELELPDVLDANDAYSGDGFAHAGRPPQPARHLAIVTCMDARMDVLPALGLAVGDAHIVRNAGGRVSDDVIRSLVVSSHVLGTREVGVIHHTTCGMGGVTNDDLAERTGVRGIDFLPFDDLDDSVRVDVAALEASPHLPKDLTVWGAVYDTDTGRLRVVAEPRSVRGATGG